MDNQKGSQSGPVKFNPAENQGNFRCPWMAGGLSRYSNVILKRDFAFGVESNGFFATFLTCKEKEKADGPGWKEEKLTDLDLPVRFFRTLKAFTGR